MDIAALTSAITDIIIRVTDDDLHRFGIRKGVLNNSCVDEEKFQKEILSKEREMVPAGSSANVVFNASAFKLQTSLLGTVGNDSIGRNYIQSLNEAGISPLLSVSDGPSGVCYVLVTPDTERTFLTKIGIAYKYDFDLSKLGKTRIFHTSGYELLTNPERTKESIQYAKNKGAKISFDLSDPIVITRHRTDLEAVLQTTDFLFATTEEAEELTGRLGENSLDELRYLCPVVALKRGKDGSVVSDGKNKYVIPAYNTLIINTCGAGDAYTAGFLYGQILGFSLNECGHLGSYFASKVCGRKESHL